MGSIRTQPFVLFVGRITRQKGIIHLVRAIEHMAPGFQVVLCAGAPDTPEIGREMEEAVAQASAKRPGVIWIARWSIRRRSIELYSHAAVFCCPSIYEPFGIINLEAMACETAVVASAVGGIKEVVVDGETGFLVPLEQMQESPFEATDPERFARDLAARINELMADPRHARTVWPRRAEARGREVQLAGDRGRDAGTVSRLYRQAARRSQCVNAVVFGWSVTQPLQRVARCA